MIIPMFNAYSYVNRAWRTCSKSHIPFHVPNPNMWDGAISMFRIDVNGLNGIVFDIKPIINGNGLPFHIILCCAKFGVNIHQIFKHKFNVYQNKNLAFNFSNRNIPCM